jgi:uncharacterized delta-60 repeat protein
MVLLVTAACGEVPALPDAPIDAAPDAPIDAAPGFTVMLLTPAPTVPLDGANRITVAVTRSGGFAGPVTIDAVTPPAGVTVTPVTLDATTASGDVIIAGAAPLAVGGTVSLTLEATGEGLPSQTLMLSDLQVTPRPGSLDTTFNGTGFARVTFGGDDGALFTAMDVLGGKITATGWGIGGLGGESMTTMRFTGAGAADPTWNGGALVRSTFGGSSGAAVEGVAIGHQLDGRHIAIGTFIDGAVIDLAVARYSTTGGSGGSEFGSSGSSKIDLGGIERAADGVVQADNKIVVVGSKDGHYLVARLDSMGYLDGSFNGGAGYERDVLGDASFANAIVIDNQGRLVVAGTYITGNQGDVIVERRAADGTLDQTFGTGGRVVLDDAAADESAFAVRTLSDKVYVASNVTGTTPTYRVRRYLANGTLDTSFGTGGVAELPRTGGEALDMIVLADGRVVTLSRSGTSAVFGRLTASGAVDTLFGLGGTGFVSVVVGDAGAPGALMNYGNDQQILFSGADSGGSPGPGTYGVVGRIWM